MESEKLSIKSDRIMNAMLDEVSQRPREFIRKYFIMELLRYNTEWPSKVYVTTGGRVFTQDPGIDIATIRLNVTSDGLID